MPNSDSSIAAASVLCRWLLAVLLVVPAIAGADSRLGERLDGFYAREGNDGSPAAAAGNNIYLKFFEDRWIGLLFLPYPYAVGMDAARIESAFVAARARTDSAAYLRDRFGEFEQLATVQIERYGYLEDRIAFECGAMSACTLRFGEGYVELIKPGVINEHIVRYHHRKVNGEGS